MTIRSRLALLFTGLVAVILLSLSLYIYYLSQLYTYREFMGRLEERAQLAGQYFLEADEITPGTLAPIRKRFLQALPEEVTRVYDENGNELFEHETGSYEFPQEIIRQVVKQPYLQTSVDKRQIVGLWYTDQNKKFVILSSAVDTYGNSKLRNLREVLFVGFWIGIFAVYFLGRYFAAKSLEPVSRIVRQVQRIKASNLHMRLREGTGKDELTELARTFNNMLTRLEASFNSQRTFVRNASHELRTPLAILIGETEVTLNRERSQEEYKQTIETLLYQARQMTVLVNDLLSLANADQSTVTVQEEVRIDESLLDIQVNMRRAYPNAEIHLDLSQLPQNPALVTVIGNHSYLKQAISNIVQNAIKYSDAKPVSVILRNSGANIVIEIQDQGIGIEEEDLQQIFQPFFRGANAGRKEGHGIGLALTQTLILQHNGSLDVQSEVGVGTKVTITLPSMAIEPEEE